MSVNYQREGGLPGKASGYPFCLQKHDFRDWESLSNTRKTVRKMQQEHSTCILFSWNTTPLIASRTWLRQLRLPEGNSETQWPHHQLQTQSSRSSGNSALALASVPGMALFTMWIWWHCPRGDDSKLGQGQGTVVPPISSGEGETVIPTACRDTTRSSTQKKTRHQQQRQLIKGREEVCLSK